ncbi:MAG: hypothetical protein NTY35_04515 [Planctomycetota bacterium]|nr:hypothetical protein [Planctomycetota bacterium]
MRSRTVTALLLALLVLPACSHPVVLPWSEVTSIHTTGGSADAVHVVVATARGIEYAASVDGGRTFGRSVVVATEPALRVGFGRGPRVARTSPGACVVAVAHEPAEVLAWTTRDGTSWSGPIPVTRAPGAAEEGLHALASDGGSRLYATWVDGRSKQPEIWGARSADGGASWTEGLVYRSPSGSICPCCAPTIAYLADGSIAVLFRNDVDGARDPWLAISRDGGGSFEPAQKLGSGSWRIAACPADGGSIARVEGGWLAVWQRDGEIYTTSPNWSEMRQMRGMLPSLAATPTGSCMAWQDARNGKLLYSTTGGKPRELGHGVTTWSLCTTQAGRAFVAFAEGNAFRTRIP